jgi:hypothetical protein
MPNCGPLGVSNECVFNGIPPSLPGPPSRNTPARAAPRCRRRSRRRNQLTARPGATRPGHRASQPTRLVISSPPGAARVPCRPARRQRRRRTPPASRQHGLELLGGKGNWAGGPGVAAWPARRARCCCAMRGILADRSSPHTHPRKLGCANSVRGIRPVPVATSRTRGRSQELKAAANGRPRK